MKKISAVLLSLLFILSAFSAFAVSASAETVDTLVAAGQPGSKYNFVDWNDGVTIQSAVSSDPSVFRLNDSGDWKAIKPGTATVEIIAVKDGQKIPVTVHVSVCQFLRRSDFNFNKKVNGYSNYIDHIENYKDKDDDDTHLTALVQTSKGTQGRYHPDMYYAIDEWKNIKGLNLGARGIKIGDSKEKVLQTFGYAYKKTSEPGEIKINENQVRDVKSNEPFTSYQNEFDKPVEGIIYTYYVDNISLFQAYYFDEQGKVCMIVWNWVSN